MYMSAITWWKWNEAVYKEKPERSVNNLLQKKVDYMYCILSKLLLSKSYRVINDTEVSCSCKTADWDNKSET